MAGGAAAPPGAAAADRAHGHVAAVPGAGRGERRRGGEPPHRLALRRQRARAATGALATPWLLLPGARASAARSWRPPRRTSSVGLGSLALGALRAGRGGAPGRREPADAAAPGGEGPGSRLAPALAPALCPLGLRGALARDRLVPRARRGRQVDGLHVRHGARRLPARLGPRCPRRGPAREPRRAGRCGRSCSSSARSWPSPRCRSSSWSRCRPTPGASPGSSPTGGTTPSSRSGTTPTATSIVRLYVQLPLALFFLPTLLMGALVPDPAARGPRRPGHERPQGGLPAGRQHRGLHRGEPARRPRRACSTSARPARCALLLGLGVVFALVGWRRYGREFALVRARASSCSPGRCRGPTGCGAGSTAIRPT